MMWLLKSSIDQNPIMINHKSNGDFNSHIILSKTQVGLLKLLNMFLLTALTQLLQLLSAIRMLDNGLFVPILVIYYFL
jgi:hypothetical protein